MKCPKCGTEMVEGEATVRGTGIGFWIFGLSYQYLWFRSPHGQKEKIVPPNGIVNAWRCRDCQLLTIVQGTKLEQKLADAERRLGKSVSKTKAN